MGITEIARSCTMVLEDPIMGNKYHAQKVTVDGITFDSRAEARRYAYLRHLERQGKITDLKLQVPFEVIPAQREPDRRGPIGGIKRGRLIERKAVYIADFAYYRAGEYVVEDVKGRRTKDFVLKRKLMLHVYGIRVREVSA